MNVYPKFASGSCGRCGLVAWNLAPLLSGKRFSRCFFAREELFWPGLSFTEGLSGPLLFHGDTTFLSLEKVAATKNTKTNMEHSDVETIKGTICDICTESLPPQLSELVYSSPSAWCPHMSTMYTHYKSCNWIMLMLPSHHVTVGWKECCTTIEDWAFF